jgi:hypothetical protein
LQQGRLEMLADVTKASSQGIPLEDLVESEITRVRAWVQLRVMPIGVHRHAADDPCNDACVET